MTINAINPYICLNGKSEQAIQLYQTALGARTEQLMRFADTPCANGKPADKDLITHACLSIGPSRLMLSDSQPDQPVTTGENVQIAIEFTDPAEMSKAFDALSSGGNVLLAICDAFWGAKFGMLTDAFGIRWLFNCPMKTA